MTTLTFESIAFVGPFARLGLIDYLIILFIGWMTLSGGRRGFTNSFSNLAFFGVLILLGHRIYGPLQGLVGQVAPAFNQTGLGELVTVGTCVGCIWYGSKLVGMLTQRWVGGWASKGEIERYGGLGTGLMTGGLLYLAGLLAVMYSGNSSLKNVFVNNSAFGQTLESPLPSQYNKLCNRFGWLPQVDGPPNKLNVKNKGKGKPKIKAAGPAPLLDAAGNPVLDAQGKPVLVAPPGGFGVDAAGNPLVAQPPPGAPVIGPGTLNIPQPGSAFGGQPGRIPAPGSALGSRPGNYIPPSSPPRNFGPPSGGRVAPTGSRGASPFAQRGSVPPRSVPSRAGSSRGSGKVELFRKRAPATY